MAADFDRARRVGFRLRSGERRDVCRVGRRRGRSAPERACSSKRNLDEILSSHPEPDEPSATADPFFDSDEMRALLHLVVNAVLYATSSEFTAEILRPPSHGSLGPRGKPLELSGETVFYLPNRIVIGPSQGMSDLPAGKPGRQIEKRFWVRGHWRKPNQGWQDQRLRWIAPYLKGPEMTAIIERAYELKGKGPAS